MATLAFHDFPKPVAETAAPASDHAAADRPAALRLVGFASMAVPIAGAGLPLAIFVPQLYATHFGIPLATIGFIFLLGRLWDVASDPIVGVLSDRTRSRFGRRKPWIAGGGLLFGLGSALLFFPPAALVGPLYLGLVLFVFYFGWTMIEIPFSAWAGEIDRDYHGRTRVVTYQLTLRSIGLLLTLILPTLLDQIRPGDGALKLQVVGGFILVTLFPALAASLLAFREAPLPTVAPRRAGFWKTVRIVFSDRLLLRVLASDVAVTAGQSIRAGLIVFFAVNYMGLPAWASGLYLLQFVFGVLAGPIWLRIGYRFGKRQTAILGELSQAAINIALILVFPGMLWLLVALAAAQGLTQGSGNLMLRAMVGDVADAHRVKTGHDRTGLFYSVFSLSAKLGPALGIGLALPLVAWFGFAPKGASTPGALEALKYVFALGPAAAHILAAALIWRFPLDQTAYAEVRRALDQSETRTPTA
ncbi:MAG: sodium:melibiose symporter [Sphingomonas bacterium]|uniref:MFS transporter n=1 Tax=Sphingomonas bacterium TaxID=1895847 RepID=UPI00260C1BAF|nr:MFS transporter [Sphingomonas bacterium]MDB5706770.1 sodium:melibiose symporter [Sphingomonas bacterium]